MATMIPLYGLLFGQAYSYGGANSMRHLDFGIYSGNGSTGMEETRTLERKLGQQFGILHFYTGFNQEFEQFARENLPREAADSQRQLLISWAPGISGGSLYREIAAGRVDPYLHRWARGVKKTNRPVYLRFAYEMNMSNMDWFAGGHNGSAEDFIAAWRHIHEVFEREGVENVRWVWCPHADTLSPNYTDAMAYYPGDAYVDWIGLDGYYWGGQPGQEGAAFDRIFRAVYEKASRHNKPMMIAEIGGAGGTQTVTDWHAASLDKVLREYSQIRAVVYFNADFSNRGEKDWRLTSHEEVLQRLRPYMAENPSS